MKAYLPILALAAFAGLVIWYVCRKPKPATTTTSGTSGATGSSSSTSSAQ